MANDKNKKPEIKDDAALTSRLQETPIAIVGMAALFADAPNLEKYWDNIVERVDSIVDVPPSRWAIDDYYSPNRTDPDKSYCKRGGFIPDIDFDPMEFGLPPNILEVTDVAQLLTLVVAREVLDDAGIGEGSGYNRDRVGITLGVGGGQKLITPLTSRLQYPVLDKVLKSSGVSDADRAVIIDKFKKAYVPWEENSFPGMLGNVIAGRVANRFDLGGMNCVVDAACAGSLAAIKLAVSDLLERRSDYMITGGVCADNSPFMYMSFSKTPAFTTNDTIRPFDHDSKGMMVGEGIGLVALKRLEDAQRDGDRIYSVIRGIGTSSDGRFKSIYAPRPEGQMKALRRAYEDAGFAPNTVGLIEAHGTGTAAGDAAEFAALNSFFSENGAEKNQIALGTVKSQIGHTKSAAGAAGLIKAALALHHKVLPATINVTKPNPVLGVEDSPFHVNTETRPWMPRADGVLRRAGVSSFGFGGTNFHFVLEEEAAAPKNNFRISTNGKAIVLAADNTAALTAAAQQWIGKLTNAEQGSAAFAELAAQNGLRTIAKNQARVGFVAKNAQDAATLLETVVKQLQAQAAAEQWSLPSGVTFRREGIDTNGKLAALFSGQGSQYVNMAREVTYNFPPLMQTIAAMDALFVGDGKKPLSSLIFPNPVFDKADAEVQEKHLQLTQHAQPSIGIVGVGFYKLLQSAGFKADFAAGHSFGELTALWAGGVLADDDYLMLAKARGQAMSAPDDANFDAGTMIAVVGDVDKVAADIAGFENVSIANYNSKDQVVVAGATEQVNKAFDALKQKGYKVVKLPVSAAFHTPLVGHAQKPFADAIEKAKFNKPNIPVFANGTGKAHSDKPADIKKVMKNHILESVRFKDEVENMYAAGGRVFVEFGPKNVLTKLVENILGDKADVVTVALNANPKKDSDTQLRSAAVQLAVIGVQLADIDPYAFVKPVKEGKKKSPMTIKLNAGAYVSDKTRKVFADALQDGHRIKGESKVEVVEKIVEKVVEKIVERIVEVPVAGAAPVAAAPVASAGGSNAVIDAGSVLDSIEKTLSQFVGYQRETAAVHEKYLEAPKVYSETFLTLMQQQMALAAQGVAQLPDSIDRSMTMFHQLQAETLRAHESYLSTQASSVNAALGMVQNQYAGLVSGKPLQNFAPVVRTQANTAVQSAPVVPAVATSSFAAVSAPVVSPAATPVVPPQAPVAAAAYAAPAQVAAVKAAPAPVVSAPQPIAQAVSAPASTGIDVAAIQKAMLEVVAEKTGYPAEMLELSMDMEADLGIDSIKRVEILGSVQEQLPQLPELNPEDLAELRTLGQIVDYMKSKAPAGGAVAAPVANAAAAVAGAAAPAAGGIDVGAIQKVMMSVVAEKTGYPAEMLELSMDMEADLGIDSIKRVEILGSVQEELPGLPELNPEDLAELRTLGQIVDYMKSKAPAGVASAAPVASAAVAAPVAGGMDVGAIQKVMMSVVAEKTGYPAEMLELSMDMEADLGIDSIKRVEILGAVQEELPGLPELNPEDLAELRTLGQIVDYMKSKAPAGVASAAPVANAAVAAPAAGGVDVGAIQKVMMSVVAEKTGYPAEMLELSMDMEADLGIDSIKRVEILGAVQEELPGLPELNPEDLAELRTLGQIVDYMKSKAPAASAAFVAAPTAALVTAQPATAASGVDVAAIQKVMMTVVAEKTGYPAEMLELSMDMEADLGIDSIKRVEILGAVQEELPGLPELNPEDLAELRTLGQIVDYMKSKAGSVASVAAAAPQAAPAAASASVNVSDLQPIVLAIVAEKTGYPVEMLELDMDMEADLGIDSIKRVEILSSVQERVPGLPEFNPDVLAEFRTLQQIVDAMSHTQASGGAAAAPKAAPTFAPAPSATVIVKKLPQPDQVAVSLPKASLCLVNDDGSSAVTPLITQLQKQGWEVAVLQWPLALAARTAKLPSNVKAVNVAEATEGGLQAAIETVTQTIGNIAALIHLQPARKIKGIEYPDAARDLLRLVFLQAKHLKVALNEAAASGGRAAFITVSRIDGQLGWKGGDSDLLQAGLFGLTKTAYHEWPNVFCRAIDADPKFDGEALAKAIVAELWDADRRISEVGLSSSERVTLVAQETDSYAQASGKSISKDSVFLVSGGAKGVTTACVAALAKNYGGKYILMGRSELLAAEPAWSAGVTVEAELKKRAMAELTAKGDKPTPVKVQQFLRPILSSREISQALDAIRKAGGEAEYVAGDVTDAAGIKAKLAPITAKLGKITGIVHGAGVLADRLIEQKTVKDFDAVYGTKIDGLAAMLACVDIKAITHFVMFSSAAGFYGNVGQSDYAIANDILNKTSVRFKQLNPSAQCLAFDWGPWDGGMVTPELKRMFTERGVYIIPLEAGAQLFASEVGASANRCPQIIVGNEMQGAGAEGTPAKKSLASRLSRGISRTANPFVEHHVIGGNPVMPTVAMTGWMAAGCEALYAGYHYAGLRNYRLFKGVVFDGSEPAVIHLDTNPQEPVNGELVVKVQIYSDNNGKRVNHYGADVVLNTKLPAAPQYASAFAKAGGAATASYRDGTLFHGALLQGINEELEFSDKRLVLGCTITAPTSAQQGQFLVDTTNLFADDLLFQAMLVWARKQYGAGSLPSSVAEFEQYRVALPGERCFIVVDVVRHSEKALVADVSLLSADGVVISRFKAAEVTISQTLNTLFKPAANG